ncbi:MAG: Rieske (2Fe-2S) protein [Halothiobacillus sp.]
MTEQTHSEWLPVCAQRELALGERRVIAAPDEDILVVNADGVILAVANQCSHQALPLDEGSLDGDLITCPYHNAQFCLRTGEALSAPAYEPIGCYDIKIEHDQIFVAATPR